MQSKGGRKKKKKATPKFKTINEQKLKEKKNKKRSDFTFFFSRPKREFSKKKKTR